MRPSKFIPRVIASRFTGRAAHEAVSVVRTVGLRRAVMKGYMRPSALRALLALSTGNERTAAAVAGAALRTRPSNELALWTNVHASRSIGDLEAEVQSIGALRRVHDSRGLERRERDVQGRLRETDPAWLPDVGLAVALTPRSKVAILHLHKESLPDEQNGFTLRSRAVIRSQREAGLDPFVVTALGFPSKRSVGPEPEDIEGFRHYRLTPPSGKRPRFEAELQLTAEGLLPIVEAERPSLIHVASGRRGYDLAVSALAVGRRFSLPVVYEVRGFFEEVWASDRSLATGAKLTARRYAREQQLMLDADAVVTIGDPMRAELVTRGVPPDRITVVPNAVDETFFRPAPADPALRQRLGLGERTVIGYVTTLDAPREGVDVLIRGLAVLARTGLPVVGLIVGDGRLRPELERLAAELGIRDAVVFTGRVPHAEVPQYYALIDLFVVPRRADRAAEFTSPLKPFEAMAMARPLLVSDLPALLDLAGNGERGTSFRAEEPDALAAAARALIDSPDTRARLGKAGHEWVLRERTWSANGRRYRDLFERVIAARRGA